MRTLLKYYEEELGLLRAHQQEFAVHSPAIAGALLRRPSPTCRFALDLMTQTRLLSLLSLNHQSLLQEGLPMFQELLKLHNLPASRMSRRQIQGLMALALAHRASSTWMPDASGGTLVFGINVLLTVDEDAYVGSGLHVFAQVIDHVLGLYGHVNSYCRLLLISHQSGKELLRCLSRNGQIDPLKPWFRARGGGNAYLMWRAYGMPGPSWMPDSSMSRGIRSRRQRNSIQQTIA